MNRQLLVSAAVLVSSVGCDQASKRMAAELLAGEPTRRFWGDTFRLLYTENKGAFLGLGATWPESVRFLVFSLLSSVLVLVALGWLVAQIMSGAAKDMPWSPLLGGTLLLAGGVDNLVDRLSRNGAVIDFMNLGIGGLRTGIFNVADLHIVVGGLLILWWQQRRSAEPGAGLSGSGRSP